jgi:hypothetical protein
MKISVFFYSALAFVVISGAMFGLDWQPAILSPMTPIQVVALPPPPPPQMVAPKLAVLSPATTSPAAKIPDAPSPVAPSPEAPSPAAPVAIAPAAPPVEATPPIALCDIAACTRAYHSFTPSDCTYLSSAGRKLCTKGVVPSAAIKTPAKPASSDAPASIRQEERGAQPTAQTNTHGGTQTGAKCNVSACATAYRTFTESDCTFMASGGVRRLCTK